MKFSVPTLVIISLVITCAFIEIVDAVSASPTTSPTQAPPGDAQGIQGTYARNYVCTVVKNANVFPMVLSPTKASALATETSRTTKANLSALKF
uniref:Secreted protein n=1 Tax=Chenopodium quinoa TaxID=63459 RepID=A0A803ND16_CHEQI